MSVNAALAEASDCIQTASKAAKKSAEQTPYSAKPPPLSSGDKNEVRETSMLGSGVSLSFLLKDMYSCRAANKTSNFLRTPKWFDINLPQGRYTQKRKTLLCLELMQYVAKPEELTELRTKELSDTDLNQLSLNIERRAFDKMWEFEGILDVAAANLTNQRSKGKKKEPLLFAIGGRLSHYKKNVLKIETNEPLRERPTTAPEPLEQPAISDSVRNGLDPNRPVPIIGTKKSNERLAQVHERVKQFALFGHPLKNNKP